MKNYFSLLLLFLAALIYTFSCSENNSTGTHENRVKVISKQIPGCLGGLHLSKSANSDSCFSYSFDDTLKIEFCVFGNCCPDSQRFASEIHIKSDTIFATVVDTAGDLCYCICNYKIHLEISGLSGNQYLFYCDYPEPSGAQKSIKYRELIKR